MAHDHQLTAAIPLLFKHLDVKFIYICIKTQLQILQQNCTRPEKKPAQQKPITSTEKRTEEKLSSRYYRRTTLHPKNLHNRNPSSL
jgi:hypothetical protein